MTTCIVDTICQAVAALPALMSRYKHPCTPMYICTHNMLLGIWGHWPTFRNENSSSHTRLHSYFRFMNATSICFCYCFLCTTKKSNFLLLLIFSSSSSSKVTLVYSTFGKIVIFRPDQAFFKVQMNCFHLHIGIPTNPFTTLELQNPSHYVHELHTYRRSPDLADLKLWKGSSGYIYIGRCAELLMG